MAGTVDCCCGGNRLGVPELPEVETVRRGLAPILLGRTVASAEVHHPRAVRRHKAGPADFVTRLRGRTLQTPKRRGKYLWVPMDGDDVLVAHLGMSGQFRLSGPSVTTPHIRVSLTFTDGFAIDFVDQRTFGGLSLEPVAADGVPVSVAHIGLDSFDKDYDLDRAVQRLRARRTQVKRALLDQTVVSGIGNIYADEALWLVGLHGERLTQRLSRRQASAVLTAAHQVMAAALLAGGTSFDSQYVRVNGNAGSFDRSLNAYGREGEPCQRCGTAIRRQAFTNRSSYFCPRCQQPPRLRQTTRRGP